MQSFSGLRALFPFRFALILLAAALVITFAWARPVIGEAAPESSRLPAAPEGAAEAAAEGPEIIAGRLLIRLSAAAAGRLRERGLERGLPNVHALNRKRGAERFETLVKRGKRSDPSAAAARWQLVTFPTSERGLRPHNPQDRLEIKALKQVLQEYAREPDVEAVEFDYAVRALEVPNDPFYLSSGAWGQSYGDLWGLRRINPEPAWSTTTGSAQILVADIDTGVDRNHPDLAGALWVNSSEVPGNRIDDDGNGYIDDYYGYNFVNNTGDPMDDHGHGTHTVGTIGALGNNGAGVVGVNWNTRIMALKFLASSGSGSTSNAIRAIHYAADMGARVSSNSWGCVCNSSAMDDAVQYAHDKGMLFVAAAGNSSADALDHSPAASDGAIAVAATDPNDLPASFSNWGEKIDVAAPGVDILSLKAAVAPMCTAERIVAGNYCRVRARHTPQDLDRAAAHEDTAAAGRADVWSQGS